MPLQRLRRVLEADYRVSIESNDRLVAIVNRYIRSRRLKLQRKGAALPNSKTPTVLGALRERRYWNVRAIDLLHKIGYLTTPSWANMARLSASWATRRYFWAIGEPVGRNPALRLSADARRMDFHQKTLVSDEFGIGMAGLLMENFFGAGAFADVSVALDDPAAYQDIDQEGETQPDYLMWAYADNSPYYVVECKGSQCNRTTSYDQLRRGLEQVPSVVFGAGPRQVITVVVATCLLDDHTEVFVLDPPPEDKEDNDRPEDVPSERVSERVGKRAWRIPDPERFRQRSVFAEESNLLRWAGQYHTAAVRDQRLEQRQPEQMAMPNVPLEAKRTNFGVFRGFEQVPFPGLSRTLRLFTRVDEALLESLIAGRPPAEIEMVERADWHAPNHLPANMSVSRAGTCMILEGL